MGGLHHWTVKGLTVEQRSAIPLVVVKFQSLTPSAEWRLADRMSIRGSTM